ncbi:major facilitator superfamily domain-containing protein [Phyllosticta citriasiana]|uniref:Major facilitator superfamily domain-containing protein n=1 Tax=Phyllosticta citriasiana TaxID=595635 RepID=A0ABR1KPL4_9PEZI
MKGNNEPSSFGSSVCTPAVFEVREKFNVSTTAGLLGLSLYVFGLAFGPVMAAPISETAGRNFVYMTTFPIFMLFTMRRALIFIRVTSGSAAGMYADRWQIVGTAAYITWPFFGPSLGSFKRNTNALNGPIVGGFVAEHKDWHWTQWTILFGALPIHLMTLCIPKTYQKTLMKRRAKQRGLPLSPKEREGAAAIKFLISITLIRPVFYFAFCFTVLFAPFEAYPIVFGGIYGMSISHGGLPFLGIAVGVLIAVATALWVDEKWYQPQRVGMPVALFWFGWSARASVSYWSPLLAGVPFAWGTMAIFIGIGNYMVNTHGPLTCASVFAASRIVQNGLGATFPLFTIQIYTKLGVDWASSLLVFISLALLPVPWVLFKWGPKIRYMSRYDTIAD